MQFPMCRRPYPGELFYGYMRALCDMNGIDRMEVLEHYFLSHGADNVGVNVGIPAGLAKICDVVENQTFPSLEEAIAMTSFYGIIEGLKPGQVAKLAETMIYAQSSAVTDVTHGQEKSVVKICPNCWNEDEQQYGTGYLHIEHHLPDVKVCWKHKKVLCKVPVLMKRRVLTPISLESGEPVLVENMEQAVLQANQAVESMRKMQKQSLFQKIQCADCGKEYILPQWSIDTGALCPYCSEDMRGKEIIQHRLDVRYPGEYRVISNDSFMHTEVVHLPCGSRTSIKYLLYAEDYHCPECAKLIPKNLYRKYGSENWIFYDEPTHKHRATRVYVKHRVCGTEFSMFYARFASQEGGFCPYCENPQMWKKGMKIDDDYKVVGDYKNAKTLVDIKHLSCGYVFKCSKARFMKGTRCPICVPIYTYQDVAEAVERCTSGYVIEGCEDRGFVNIIHGDTVHTHISYQLVMVDLKRKVPKIFKDRHTVYEDKRTFRKMVYENVVFESLRKGCWTFEDGLDGKELTRPQKKKVQKMARDGYICRLKVGKYAITGGENT